MLTQTAGGPVLFLRLKSKSKSVELDKQKVCSKQSGVVLT